MKWNKTGCIISDTIECELVNGNREAHSNVAKRTHSAGMIVVGVNFELLMYTAACLPHSM